MIPQFIKSTHHYSRVSLLFGWRECLVLGILGFGLALGVWIGALFLVLAGLAGCVVVLWSYLHPKPFQYLAVGFLLLTPLLMVATPLRPTEFNYSAYAAGVLVAVGFVSAVRAHHRIGVMGIFLFWLVISAVATTARLHPDPAYSIVAVPLGMLGIYLLLAHAQDDVRDVFIGGALLLMAVEAALGILQTTTGFPTFSVWDDVSYSEPRNYLALIVPTLPSQVQMAPGTFEHFNGLGGLMSIAVPLAYSNWQRKKTLPRLLYLILILAGLVSTFSRGALIGGIVGVGLLYLLKQKGSRERLVHIAVLVALGIVIGTLAYSTLADYASSTGTFSARLEAWRVALGYAASDPLRLLLGAGYGFFAQGYLAAQGAVETIHSAPIQILAETGVLGLGLFLWGVGKFLHAAIRSREPQVLALGASAAAFFAHQLFDNALFGFLGILLVGVLALIHGHTTANDGDHLVVSGDSGAGDG